MRPPVTARPPRRDDGRHDRRHRGATGTRDVVAGGVLGGIPGLAVALVPMLLFELGVISSDQSQIGFLGVPVLFAGVLAGALGAASGTPAAGAVGLGLAAGFGIGLGAGLLIDSVLTGVGVTLPGMWLVLAGTAMVAGGAVGARLHRDR